MKPALIAGGILSLGLSLGEMGVTYVLYRPELTTMPIAIYRYLSARDLVGAAAMGVVLMVLCTALFLLVERLGGPDVEGI